MLLFLNFTKVKRFTFVTNRDNFCTGHISVLFMQ